MSNKAVIVTGEASETDSDEDTLRKSLESSELPPIQGLLIQGEDSESDQETPARASEDVIKGNIIKEDYTDSLLHKKLRESNRKLHEDVVRFVESTLGESRATLAALEHDLVRCQLTMHAAVSSLQHLTTHSDRIRARLDAIVASDFLKAVKIVAASE